MKNLQFYRNGRAVFCSAGIPSYTWNQLVPIEIWNKARLYALGDATIGNAHMLENGQVWSWKEVVPLREPTFQPGQQITSKLLMDNTHKVVTGTIWDGDEEHVIYDCFYTHGTISRCQMPALRFALDCRTFVNHVLWTPKFKVGDRVKSKEGTLFHEMNNTLTHMEKIIEHSYLYENEELVNIKCPHDTRHWVGISADAVEKDDRKFHNGVVFKSRILKGQLVCNHDGVIFKVLEDSAIKTWHCGHTQKNKTEECILGERLCPVSRSQQLPVDKLKLVTISNIPTN